MCQSDSTVSRDFSKGYLGLYIRVLTESGLHDIFQSPSYNPKNGGDDTTRPHPSPHLTRLPVEVRSVKRHASWQLHQRMAEQRHEHVEVLAHSLWPAGQVDDERVRAHTCSGAREGGQRLKLDGLAQ